MLVISPASCHPSVLLHRHQPQKLKPLKLPLFPADNPLKMNVCADLPEVKPCDQPTIIAKVKQCPRLPSLRSIETALKELLNADNRFTTQISEVIRRDPSLTARLLRLVNSVYYGLTTPVNSIEEAVFYLGVRQIRQLA